jgi:hypothetical protein
MRGIDTSEWAPLEQAKKQKEDSLRIKEKELAENQFLQATANKEFQAKRIERSALRKQLRNALVAVEEISAEPGCIDEAYIYQVRTEMEGDVDREKCTLDARLNSCLLRERLARTGEQEALARVNVAFQRYLDSVGITLVDELRDWRSGLAWATHEHRGKSIYANQSEAKSVATTNLCCKEAMAVAVEWKQTLFSWMTMGRNRPVRFKRAANYNHYSASRALRSAGFTEFQVIRMLDL